MALRIGFVSTYPPTQCGLATFTSALMGALTSTPGHQGWVARLTDARSSEAATPGVVAEIVSGDHGSTAVAAKRLNEADAVILQHEFGVYGGTDGQDVLLLLDQLRVPAVVVLHTVPAHPTHGQRRVLEMVVAAADAVVTMTVAARDRLFAGYLVDADKVSIIAHGAADMQESSGAAKPVFRTGKPVILTWGLLGPGKGIEWGIEAMALLRDIRPEPTYVIAGRTHPKVAASHGEAYRDSLGKLISRLQLATSVRLEGGYRDAGSLAALVNSADIVLLPYDSRDQVTSGVLIEAVAAGKPVVATAFPHAVELLSSGAGLVVPHEDPQSMADALRAVLDSPQLAASMSRAARAAAPQLQWSAVAERYTELVRSLVQEKAGAAA